MAPAALMLASCRKLVALALVCLIFVSASRCNAGGEPLPLVIPRPKSIRSLGGDFPLNALRTVFIAGTPSSIVACILRDSLGPHIDIVPLPSGNVPEGAVVVGEPGKSARFDRLLRKAGVFPRRRNEAYVISVARSYILVGGNDAAGVVDGVETLTQLLAQARETRGRLPQLRIDDYPCLGWRGVHLFTGNMALPFHRRLVARVLAPCHMNRFVVECEQAHWQTTSVCAPVWAMPKADLVADANWARARGLEVVPLVESAAHMTWLLQARPFADLAEDPRTPWAVRPADPRVYRVLFSLYDEVTDTLHPQEFHVGGDELMLRGRYPYRSKNRYSSATQALADHLVPIRRHLFTRNATTLIWSDMLLSKEEGAEPGESPSKDQTANLRRRLPKDVTICDWHYGLAGRYPSVQILRNCGFRRVIACTWRDPNNVLAFTRQAARDGAIGTLQTTWCGYNSAEANVASNADQFAAIVLSAEESWNGGRIALKDLGYDPWQQFQRLYGKQFLATPSSKSAKR